MEVGAPQRVDLGDPDQFARIAREHAQPLYATALAVLRSPADAQDVVQDVLLRLWLRPAAFDASRGPLSRFLHLMTRSRAIDVARGAQARRARERVGLAAVRDDETGAPSAADVVARADARRRVRAALHELPREQREAVVLAYWGELTATEIAHSTRVPLGTAKSRVRLGLRKLANAHV